MEFNTALEVIGQEDGNHMTVPIVITKQGGGGGGTTRSRVVHFC